MLKINRYSLSGVRGEDFSIPSKYQSEENLVLIAQAVRVSEVNSHPGLSKTKTRSEVNRTTKKWFKQKGTGRARHGARSAPIFVGGGTAHGPKNIKRYLKISQSQARKALKSLLSLKIKEKQVVLVDGFSNLKKTSQVEKMLQAIFKNLKVGNPKTAFVFSSANKDKRIYTRNIKDSKTYLFENLGVLDIFKSDFIVLDQAIFKNVPNKVKSKKENKK